MRLEVTMLLALALDIYPATEQEVRRLIKIATQRRKMYFVVQSELALLSVIVRKHNLPFRQCCTRTG